MKSHFPKRTVVSVDGPVAGVAITCDSGAAWITQCCDSMDYVLNAGRNFAAHREGKIVVQIVKDAKISIRLRDQTSGELRPRASSNRARFRIASILRWGCRFLIARR